jgi:hypothetical protein
MKLSIGSIVSVTDPDGIKWTGIIDCPSPLWADWWVVRRHPSNNGRIGRVANYHVHVSEMKALP